MAKLTKTEIALLERAKANKDGRVYTGHGYRTMRKNGSWGGREVSAAVKLMDAGLIRFVSQASFLDCTPHYSDHWTETVYELVK